MKINKLSNFTLKIIGMLTMVIDHVGYFLFPHILVLRIIGRISFPIFAFLCAESMHYSSNKFRYITTLLSLDIIISLVIYLATGVNHGTVFSCLGLSALIIYLLQNKNNWIKALSILPIAYVIIASLKFTPVTMQYSLYGVILIIGFYFIRVILSYFQKQAFGLDENNNTFNFKFYHALSCSLFLLTICLLTFNFSDFFNTYLSKGNMDYSIQSNAFLACPFILLYSGTKGYSKKWFKPFSYLFYPGHVLIILLIQIIMQMI